MAKKVKAQPKKKKKAGQQGGSSVVPMIVFIAFIAMIIASWKLSSLMNPMYLFGVLAVLSYPLVVRFLCLLNKFAESPVGVKTYIPFVGESSNFLSTGLEIAHNILFALCLVGVVSMVGGNFVSALSIPYLVGSLIYGGADVMNNAAVLNLFVFQTYALLVCYALLCVVRGIAYCQLDMFIAREDSRIYLQQSSRRKKSSGEFRAEKHFSEYLFMVMYFIPVLRVLGIALVSQRLSKLVVMNALTVQSKTRSDRVVVESEDDIV